MTRIAPPAERTTYRVVKTLQPNDRGALDLARQYGKALVCVRYRTDAKGKVRHITVELLVRSTPIRPRSVKMVFLQIDARDSALIAVVRAAGGTWDRTRRQWQLPSRVASILNLRHRIANP